MPSNSMVENQENCKGHECYRRFVFNKAASTKNAMEVTRQDWAGFCHHVANLEAEYWEKDGVVPDVIDLISINLNTDTDSEAGGSDSENGSSSSEESE
ncbi:hypothetical protein ANN_13624 [Periplaneta americana]|uniref:Uncharacterized protein n=1 Tax=Periplaneta americana TaxID=6978 RepID=A0ABQ8TJX5_PERAM|nr:hypothetical protein ANN_13624 [Periplaneta americana]